MLILLSPAKKQTFAPPPVALECTPPQAQTKISTLIKILKQYSPQQLSKLMSISDSLAQLNHQRYQQFNPKYYHEQNATPALFAFQGDVYRHLDAASLKPAALQRLQQQLIILSGLYGYLRPFDFIQPYRLEMKTRLATSQGKDLYQFWGDTITQALNAIIATQQHRFIINLASQEYFKAIQPEQLNVPVITIHFKEQRGQHYKVIGVNAKRARGLMTRYIASHNVRSINKLKQFNVADYQFNPNLSDENSSNDKQQLTFTRTTNPKKMIS